MRRRKRSAIDFRLEIAPVNLIDLLLVMLIFFVTTTTFLQLRIIELGLPKSDAAALQKADKSMHIINIDRDCIFYLDTKAVEKTQLSSALKAIGDADKDARFQVGADEESPHRCFVNAIEIMQKAGIADIGILTKPGQ